MGSFYSKIWQILYSDKGRRILILGLDASGRTTMLYKLKLVEVLSSIPTIGFSVEKDLNRKYNFQIWDIDGQLKLRDLWHSYYKDTEAVIFIVDSPDRERVEEATEVLHEMLENELIKGIPLLVFANKQDLPHAMTVLEIANKLDLHSIRGRPLLIQAACAIAGEGIYEGLDWLRSILPIKY
ncbi:unnamed protein product [Blepharisma stoltei]|uniref:ADP-ribosylation factor n=1 Tax=Blepharisma stoltei TaxID=1481888 RepID=A0AAU9JCH1_9CILI|nr:unnamed protein product [Blepharisma stoltei]